MTLSSYMVEMPISGFPFHGCYVSLRRKGTAVMSHDGQLLWQLRKRRRFVCWEDDVFDAEGNEVYLAVTKKRILDVQGAHHQVWRDGELLGESRTNRLWTGGTIQVGSLPPVRFKLRQRYSTLQVGAMVVAHVYYANWHTADVQICHTIYNVPEFVIAFAMLLEDLVID